MRVPSTRPIFVALTPAFLLGFFTVHAGAETIVGLLFQNHLISFDSATPATSTDIGAVTGLALGDTLVGIDRRPQLGPNHGVLYGVGVNTSTGTGRIYTLNTTTAAATLVSSLVADPADTTAPFPFTSINGSFFGVDFNPVADRLRVTSNLGLNFRINVDNGLVQLDVPLAYQVGDPNFGETPLDVAVAYSNNTGGATSTVLRGIDITQDPDLLVVHTNPNGGTLQTSLNLPFNAGEIVSYDISGLTGTGFFAVTPIGSISSSSLFAAGPDGVSLVGSIGGGSAIVGLAAPVGEPAVIPAPASVVLLALGAIGVLTRALRRRSRAQPTEAL